MGSHAASGRIALIGDRSDAVAAHRAIPLALELAAGAGVPRLTWEWLPTSMLTGDVPARLAVFDGIWCVPASPYVNTAGALAAIRVARERQVPFLGTCGGFQHALLDYAAAVWEVAAPAHAELDPAAERPSHRAAHLRARRADRRHPLRARLAAAGDPRPRRHDRGLSLQLRVEPGLRGPPRGRSAPRRGAGSRRRRPRRRARRPPVLRRDALPARTLRARRPPASLDRGVRRRGARAGVGMTGLMPDPRSRVVYAVAILLVVAAGLGSRVFGRSRAGAAVDGHRMCRRHHAMP